MLRYKVHQIQVGQRHYILLPKMTRVQMQKLGGRLAGMGYTLANSRTLSAVSSGRTIHVDPAGFCWSTVDPADAILPAIPEVLESSKEPMPWDALRSLYLRLMKSGPLTMARVSTRVEGYSVWDELRGAGRCALAPDEHAMACFLMRSSSSCELLADFITDGSSTRRYGKKLYYEAELGRAKGEETLRVVGANSPRNAYLPRDGLLMLHRFTDAPREAWIRLLDELGEWCYFVPAQHESSNSRHRRPIPAPVV